MKKLLLAMTCLVCFSSFALADTVDDAISWMYDNGLTIHNNKADFKATKGLRRDEAAKFFVNFAKLLGNTEYVKTASQCTFSDINNSRSDLKDIVVESCKLGLFQGSHGKFNPTKQLTNAQAITVLVRLLAGNQSEIGLSHRANNYYTKANELGILTSVSMNGKDSTATRGNVGVIIWNGNTNNNLNQNIYNVIATINWDENIIEKVDSLEGSYSIEAYCFINDNTMALLASEETIVYSISQKKVLKTFPIGGSDIDCYNNKYYILGYKNGNIVYTIDNDGNIQQELNYRIPARTPFALEKFKLINGKNIITIADGTTWEVNNSGLEKIDNYYWYYKGEYKARAEKIDLKIFNLSLVTSNNISKKFKININNFGLNDNLATVKIVDIKNNQIALDIETTTDNENDMPKRFLVFTDFQGKIISKNEIPFIYSTWIKNQFVSYKSGLMYSLSDNDGLKFYYFYPENININTITYNNSTYGFSLELPPSRTGYIVTTSGNAIKFGFIQQSRVLTINAISHSEWNDMQNDLMHSTYLGENSNYVFVYDAAQDAVNQTIANRMGEINEIVQSFQS